MNNTMMSYHDVHEPFLKSIPYDETNVTTTDDMNKMMMSYHVLSAQRCWEVRYLHYVLCPPGVVFDTTSEGPHSLFVPIVTRFVPIVTKYT